MRTVLLPWLLLAACAEGDGVGSAQLPPPASTLGLTLVGEATPGRLWGVEVTGARPGQTVEVLAADGGVALDQGDCRADLGGNCLDMLPGRLGYRQVAAGRADLSGTFRTTAPFPRAVADGTYQLQAVVADGASSNESAVEEVTVRRDCRVDALEPNDSLAAATPITGDVGGLVVCTGEADFLQTTVPPGAYVELTVTHASQTDGDLDVELRDARGDTLDWSARATDVEVVTWLNGGAAPADVFLYVYPWWDLGRNGVGYDVALEVVQPGVCPDDAAEDDDTRATGQLVGPGRFGGQACAADSDWYLLDVAAGDVLRATVSAVDAAGLVGLTVYDAQGVPANPAPQAQVVAASPVDQRYAVEVVLESDDPLGDGNAYELLLEVSTPGVCVDDGFEDDDDPGAARAVGAGRHAAWSCLGDDDWYAIDVGASQQLDLVIDEDTAFGDVSLHVYSGALQRLTTTPVDRFQVAPNADETVYVQVLLDVDDALGGGNGYELVATLEDIVRCPLDRWEPDDRLVLAQPFSADATYTGLGACVGSDPDWVAVPVPAGRTLDATIRFLHADADVDLELYSPSGQLLQTSASVTDQETVSVTATTSAVYYLRVYLYAENGGPTLDGALYDLELALR